MFTQIFSEYLQKQLAKQFCLYFPTFPYLVSSAVEDYNTKFGLRLKKQSDFLF